MAVAVALLVLLVGLTTAVESEGQAAKPAAKSAAAPAKPPAQRRDPFRSLVAGAGGAGGLASCPSPGKAGLMIGQLSIVGIVITPNDSVAVANMSGRNRAYFLRERDELCDGIVSRITPENVSFREKAKDAYGRAYEKEVVKQLTAGSSGAKR